MQNGSTLTADGIKTIRTQLKLTVEQFATQIGVTAAQVYKWESGASSPRGQRLQSLLALRTGKQSVVAPVRAYGGGTPERRQGMPMRGSIPAGPGAMVDEENTEEQFFGATDLDPHDHFALRVHGGSMAPKYQDGDIVVCRRVSGVGMPVKAEGPTSAGLFSRYVGKDVSVLIDERETTLKRLELHKRGVDSTQFQLMLRALNPDYPNIDIGPDNSLLVQGEVVRMIRNV